jgi:hypothetical protein
VIDRKQWAVRLADIDPAGRSDRVGGWADISVQKVRRHHTRRKTGEVDPCLIAVAFTISVTPAGASPRPGQGP